MSVLFADRAEAGRALARQLAGRVSAPALVLGLARGGVPVAAEVATALGLPLGVVLVRKIGLPQDPELAAGAIAGAGAIAPDIAGGEAVATNPTVMQWHGLGVEDMPALVQAARAELTRRGALWQAWADPDLARGKTVLLVDDGIATGATMEAAIGLLRAHAPSRIVVVVPVAAEDALARIRPLADEVLCLFTPDPFGAVGAFYRDFPQVADGEVSAVLQASSRATALAQQDAVRG